MKNIWLISDVHGNHTVIHNFYEKHKDKLSENYNENLLIILGDVGANYYLNKRDDFFKSEISKYPLTYFCIRGNHEQRPSILMDKYPSDWHMEIFANNKVYVEDRFPKILYALDQGGDYEIGGQSILVVPGAYSVDKWYRIFNGWSYFPEEQLSKKEQKNLFNNLKPYYNCIFSHTCPDSWTSEIKDLFLPQVNQSLVDRSTEKFLDKIYFKTAYDYWFFGHYHDNRELSDLHARMVYHEAIPFIF